MSMKTIFIVILSVLGLHNHASAQLHVPGLEKFREIMSNYSMNYTMKCTYPGGQVYEGVGKMAVKGDKFYDSSNLRHVLQDDTWYIIADHIERIISVAYIKEINNDLDGVASVTASSYLFDDDLFEGLLKIDVIKQNDDTSWLSLHFKDTSVIEKFEIRTLRKNLQPVSYNAVIYYSAGGYEDEVPSIVKLEIACYNIISPVSDALFDVNRLLSVKGKTATLKRFNTYKTYK